MSGCYQEEGFLADVSRSGYFVVDRGIIGGDQVLGPAQGLDDLHLLPQGVAPAGAAEPGSSHESSWEKVEGALAGGIGQGSASESSSSSSSSSSSEDEATARAPPPVLQPPVPWRAGCAVGRHTETRKLHLARCGRFTSGASFTCGREITSAYAPLVSTVVLQSDSCSQCDNGRHIRSVAQLNLEIKRQRMDRA